MKIIPSIYIPVAVLFSIAAVFCYPLDPNENYDHLCVNVVIGIREHPESCNRYIECDKFTAKEVTCPEGQVFSKEQIRCVEGGDPQGCRQGEPIEEEVKCVEGYRGRMACPGDCYRYYSCSDGMARLESCLEGYVYFEPMKVCLPGYDLEGKCELYSTG